jgi:nucleoside-diphosphate kinase
LIERTLSLIKPDGVEQNCIGEVIHRFETKGLRVVALKLVRVESNQAEAFYAVHRERPFYRSLTAFLSSGPVVAMVLEGERAITLVRQIMGATDPAKAEPGTIRRDLATGIERNVVHGSDGPETAVTEIAFFFNALEIVR